MSRFHRVLILACTLTAFCVEFARAQESVQALASAGPSAIFVSLGNLLPSPAGSIISEYRVERRAPATKEWNMIGVVRSPLDESSFNSALQRASGILPHLPLPPAQVASQIWSRAKQFGRLDSLGYWGSLPSVQCAVGAMAIDSTAVPAAAYEYRVVPVRADGKTARSVRSREVRLPGLPPLMKLRQGEATHDPGVVSLRWRAANDDHVSALLVFREGNASGSFEQVAAEYGFQRTNQITYALAQDRSEDSSLVLRYFSVPVDLYGNRGYASDTITVGTYTFSAASKISGMRVGRADSTEGIRIAWSVASPQFVRSVRIQRASSWDGEYTQIAEVLPSDSEYVDQSARPMQEYFYRLIVIGPLGETSSPSARLYGMLQSIMPPAPPTQLVARGIKNGVRLEWLVSDDDIAGYYVYRSAPVGDSLELFSPFIRAKGARSVFVDSARGMTGTRVYAYAVRSENTSHVMSMFSDTVFARPLIPTKPMSAAGVSASMEPSAVRLFWEDMTRLDDNIEGYFVHRREMPSGKGKTPSFKRVTDSLLSVNYFADTSIEAGKTYEYAIQCVDVFGGMSVPGAPVRVVIPIVSPSTPAGLRGTVSPRGINVQWDIPGASGVVGYRVYRYERGKAPVRLSEVKPDVSEFTDTQARKGQLYFYYLTSVGAHSAESHPGGEVGIRR